MAWLSSFDRLPNNPHSLLARKNGRDRIGADLELLQDVNVAVRVTSFMDIINWR
jgi:hypothetical protein